MNRKRQSWLKAVLRLQGSVVPIVLPRVIGCGVFGIFVSILYHFRLPVDLPTLSSVIPSIVLGLLLVFRTNTAYDRFWEGRKLWGNINNSVRNLSRQIWVSVEEREPKDKNAKISTLKLLVAFAVATKLLLRSETIDNDLEGLISQSRYQKLKTMNNPPLEIAFWIEDYLQEQYEKNCLHIYQLNAMKELLNILVDCLGGCERILRTPMPLAYAIHLKQLLLLYCIFLPFSLVRDFGFFTGILVVLISFALFGIEEMGVEIENPFGHDPNDLPLDAICVNIQRNIEDLITLTPYVRDWKTANVEDGSRKSLS
ncbi:MULTISPECIES: bestrophin family protein [Aerosakkonema]|uniref:bestrophin family protein n=1 Tax=Aerosakkonema TaxID=1246629 RepID=UPI0035B82093